MKISTRKLVFLSLLTALGVILTRFLSLRLPLFGIEGIRIGIGSLPIIFAGMVFGPFAGGIVGALTDLIGYWVSPMGAYMPHFTLTAFLTGFIPGFILIYLFKEKRQIKYILISITVGQVITSIILVTYFIHILFGVPYKPILIPRLVSQPINIVIYSYLINILFRNKVLNVFETS
ncbi:MAG: folate family ECF transporter S component [Halanaerobiales bacterium]|nr:folate family ECF transporter S component [Halanaerobiales bacterium]